MSTITQTGAYSVSGGKKFRVAVLQSSYIPWKGYFDIISSVDKFVFYDDVQYTKNEWRNRNKIVTPTGPTWLTVPCGSGESRLICEVMLNDNRWQAKHYKTLIQNYKKAPFFNEYGWILDEIYLQHRWASLSELNQTTIQLISKRVFKFRADFLDSRKFDLEGRKEKRLLHLLESIGTSTYISGPSAKSYISEQQFLDRGIDIEWQDYSNYPKYKQCYGDFEHGVTILDLIFNTGIDAVSHFSSASKREGSA